MLQYSFFIRLLSAVLLASLLQACDNTNKDSSGPTSGEQDSLTALSQSLSTVSGEPVSLVLGSQYSGTGSLQYEVTTLPAHGQLTGQLSGSNGNLRYMPDAGFVGRDSFLFTVTDDQGRSDSGTVSILVLEDTEPAELPRAYPQTLSTPLNQPLQIALQGLGAGSGVLVYSVTSQPLNGVLTGQLSGPVATVTYTPNLDFSGNDSFDFRVTDEQGNTAQASIQIVVLETTDPSADTDNDGLRDLDETGVYGTNPRLADTDGDGFSDFQELVTFGFNPSINNYRFNPLIADTPEVDVRIVSVPDVRINYSFTDGSSRSVGTSRTQSSSRAVSSSYSESESTTLSESHSMSVEVSSTVSVSVEVGLVEPPKTAVEASVTATAGYSYENTTTREQSSSWSEEQTRENTEAFEQSETVEQNNSISASDGEISLAVEVINRGHISYTLSNLFLSANYVRPRGADPLVPVGNLAFDGAGGSFPEVTLSPGQSTGVLTFRGQNINLEKVKEILSNSQGFSVQPTLYTLLDQDGVAYNFASTAIVSNDAMIMVDYNGNNGLESLSKMVAVYGNQGQPLTLEQALNQILRLNMTTATDGDGRRYLKSVNGLETRSEENKGMWLMLHARQTGNNQVETRIYTTPADKQRWLERNPNVDNLVDDFDPSELTLGAGDVVHLVYLQDSDSDGLSNRMERFYKSDPDNADTDGDGLADGVETKDGWLVKYRDQYGTELQRRVYSNPVMVDTDSDGVDDAREANLAQADDWLRRDPRSRDTDADGLGDEIDDLEADGVTLAANDFDDLNLRDYSVASFDDGSNGDTGSNARYSVTLSYGLPDLTSTNGSVTGYNVVTLRYRDSSGQGRFPAPQPLRNGRLYLVGDIVPCENGNSGCVWEVVSVNNIDPNAPPAGPITITENDLLQARDAVTGTPADVAQYAFFTEINGVYRKQQKELLATAETETLRIRMKSARFLNVRTVFSRNTTDPDRNAAVTRKFPDINGGEPVYFNYYSNPLPALNPQGPANCRRDQGYEVYEGYQLNADGSQGSAINGGFEPIFFIGEFFGQPGFQYFSEIKNWFCLPISEMQPGDGVIDITWWLYVDGNRINNKPYPYSINGTFDETWWDGEKNGLPGEITKNGAVTDLFVGSVVPGEPDNPVDAEGYASFDVVLPAVPGTHLVEFIVLELDRHRLKYNRPLAPPDVLYPGSNRPYEALDAIRLTRDEHGVWTAEPVTVSSSQQDTGWFRGNRNITRLGNVNPIEWVTRTLRLSDMENPGSTTMQMDMVAEIELIVR